MGEYSHDWICRNIVEGAPDAIIFADSGGIIRLWNSGAEAIFGHSASEAIGRSLDIIIPEKLRSRHNEGYRKVMGTGVSRYTSELLAVPAMRKDGARISIEFSIVVLKSDEGAAVGSAALIRDVTARWEREKAAKEATKSHAATV
ncbi:putative PAS/PAC sensor protein [Syntrophobacter sp. SbD1]|nr:putative PAS/PAC sensor protein [Syntrophobacter sp. SbD1]